MTVSGIVVIGLHTSEGGATVALTSSDPDVAAVPASVTVPAGAKSASFPISTNAVSVTMVTISAAYGGETRSMLVRILPAGVSSVSVHPEGFCRKYGDRNCHAVRARAGGRYGGEAFEQQNGRGDGAPERTVAAGAMSATFTVSANTVLRSGYASRDLDHWGVRAARALWRRS